jgi:hypothetical protein
MQWACVLLINEVIILLLYANFFYEAGLVSDSVNVSQSSQQSMIYDWTTLPIIAI